MSERLTVLLAAWVAGAQRHARRVLVVDALITVVLAVVAALFLGVNMDNKRLISEDLPFRRDTIEFERYFPSLEDALLIVIDAETPELARGAAETLTARLREHAELFTTVYRPGADAFFERHGLLYRSPDDLDDFVDQLARMQPLIADLARDGSIANLARLVRLGLEQQRENAVDAPQWSRVLDRVGEATVRVYDEYPVSVSWEQLMLAGSALDPGTRQVVVAEPVLEFGRLLAAGKHIDVIRSTARELALVPAHGVRVRVTGNPALNHEEMLGLAWDVGAASVFSFALVTGILFLAFRSLRLVSSAALTLLAGLIWTAGFATVAIGHLNVVSISFGVLFIGLGVDFAIHLGMHYSDAVQRGASSEAAFREAIEAIGTAMVLCALTTAIGFFAFIPTDYRGVAELGLIAGTGMFIILLQTLTLFPALVQVRLGTEAARYVHPPIHLLLTPPSAIRRRPGAVAGVALALGLGAAWLAPHAYVNANVVDMRDPQTESVQAFNDLLAHSRTSPWYANVLTDDLDAAVAIAARMRALEPVESTLTLADYVPNDQDEKLEILADAAFLFDAPPAAPGHHAAPPDAAEQVAALRALDRELQRPWLETGGGPLVASARQLRTELDRFLDRVARDADPEAALASLEHLLLGNFPAQVARLKRALSPDPVTLARLPHELTARMLADDGHARVQVFPRADLGETRAFTAFVDAVRGVAPHATGVAVNLVEFARATERSLREALALALAAITALLLLLWRRIVDTILALAPLLLAGLLTVAAMVLLDLPFNFANVTALPLLLGIGIDSGIHLVHQARTGDVDGHELLDTTTARAVFFSAVTTIASFGSLALSDHRGVATLGILLVVGMVMMLASNLIVLPALLALRARTRS